MDEDIGFLKRLKKMREENLITEEVYEKKKKEFLAIEAEMINVVPKSKVFYIVLAIVFGQLGFHSLYAGYNGKGMIQFLLGLFCILFCWLIFPFFILWILWVWGVVEAFVINKDAKGIPFE